LSSRVPSPPGTSKGLVMIYQQSPCHRVKLEYDLYIYNML
jgi:hypothetical protein